MTPLLKVFECTVEGREALCGSAKARPRLATGSTPTLWKKIAELNFNNFDCHLVHPQEFNSHFTEEMQPQKKNTEKTREVY